VLDATNETRRHGLVGVAYGPGSLEKLTERFHQRTLDKSHAIYKWIQLILQRAKVQYAALDAYAGAMIGEFVYFNILGMFKNAAPTLGELKRDVVVCLLLGTRPEVVAIGRVH
jgi:hypothetical protein